MFDEFDSKYENDFRTIEHESGCVVRLVRDYDPENPREWDTDYATLFIGDNRYVSGDKGAADPNDLEDDEIAALLPVYIYAHSGVCVSTRPFGDRWDSWCGGAIYFTRKQVKDAFGYKLLTAKRRAHLIQCLENVIVTFNDYLTGNIAGLIVEDPDGEEIFSCWEYYPDHSILRGRDDWQSVIDEGIQEIEHWLEDHPIYNICPTLEGAGL